MAKKYLSLERLTEYDELIKSEISAGDASTLASAKSHTNTEVAKKADKEHSHNDLYYTETEIDSKLSAVNTSITNITNGSVVVKEAEHATNADNATNATSATTAANASTLGSISADTGSATKPIYLVKGVATEGSTYAGGTKVTLNGSAKGGSTASFYAPTTAGTNGYILKSSGSGAPTWIQSVPVANGGTGATDASGARTNLEVYSKTEVDSKLSGKSDTSHKHDSLYDAKGSADTALASAKSYADEKVANLLDNSTEAVDSIMELAEAMSDNADAIKALETVAASKVPTSRKINGKALTADITLSASDVGADASGSANAVQTNLDAHTGDATAHMTSTQKSQLTTAYNHSQAAHAPSDAQANVIESIKVNGTVQTITSKSVNITVPTNNNQLTNGAGYITSSAISNKADKSTTLAGYGITNAYTKTEVDAMTAVDSALSSTSTKPVQNKVVNSAIVTATNAITANTNSINAHTDRITALETKVGDGFEEITSQEIQALFA